jgi:hypothetical protein
MTFPRTLGWSIFLGISWTWCIGMFLPVILLAHLGIAGFLVLAAPNVLGAAAMGWVIRDADASRRWVARHELACVWFSLITILFHAFFAAWLIRRIAGPTTGAAVAAVFWVFWMILQWRRGGKFLAATLTLIISLLALAWGVWRSELPYIAHPIPTLALPPIQALWMAPVFIFGFALCPYLDLTFHDARQHLDRRQARFAFTLGFAGIFLLMLLFTLAYSGWLVAHFDRDRYPQLALILSAHLIVQTCVTAALHARQVVVHLRRLSFAQFAIFSAALVISVLLGVLDREHLAYHGIGMGEMVYRCFTAFYGLALPAYVWLRMIPPARSTLRLATAILLALPLYWIGFIEERLIYLLPGAAVLFFSRYFPPAADEGRIA